MPPPFFNELLLMVAQCDNANGGPVMLRIQSRKFFLVGFGFLTGHLGFRQKCLAFMKLLSRPSFVLCALFLAIPSCERHLSFLFWPI